MGTDSRTVAEPLGPPPDLGQSCPSCGALNGAASTSCSVCGISLTLFAEAAAHLRSAQQEQISGAITAFSATAREKAAEERTRNRRQLFLLLALAFGAAAVLLLAVGLFAGWRAHNAYVEGRRLQTLEAQSQDCLVRGDYPCAESGFSAYLRARPNDPPSKAGLREARFRLAGVDEATHDWPQAERELRAILAQSPTDTEAAALLNTVYDDWFAAAAARGDWPTVISIEFKRTLEFQSGG